VNPADPQRVNPGFKVGTYGFKSYPDRRVPVISVKAAQPVGASHSLPNMLKTEKVALPSITKREFEVWREIAQGSSTRLIAERLGLSMKTVDSHREHIKEKLIVAGLAPTLPKDHKGSKWSYTAWLVGLAYQFGIIRWQLLPEMAAEMTDEQRLMRVNALIFKKVWAKSGVDVELRGVPVPEISLP